MKTPTLKLAFVAFFCLSGALSATTLTLTPSAGEISGISGSTIGWGFSLSNPSDFVVISSSNFCLGSSGVTNLCLAPTTGTYADYIATNFTIAGGIPESPVVTEAFDSSTGMGLGSFTIGSGQPVGADDIGHIVITYDLYSVDPLSPSFDPDVDLISAGNFLEAPASVVVSPSSVTTVPEPSSMLLMALAGAALVFSAKLTPMLKYSFLTKLTGSEELRRNSLPVFIAIAAILALMAVPTSSFAADSAAIPVGTEVTIRTVDRIESRKAEVGQSYRCTLNAPIIVAGKEISGRGADCILRVVETTKAGRLSGSSELKLEVAQIRVGSDLLDVNSDPSQLQSNGKGKSTGIKTGIGAVAGAGLGGLLGGKKGAAIGAGAGAGAGLAAAAITQGPEIKVAPETVLNFVIR